MNKYRVADAHAHIYPEKIAAKAAEAVGKFYGGIGVNKLGTAEELIRTGSKIGVEKYLVCSVATKVDQVDAINGFLARVCKANDSFVGLGAYHPDVKNIAETLENVKNLGFAGIKLHPDFQRFNIDDPAMLPVYRELQRLGLCVLVHIGDDRYDFSSPERLMRVMEQIPDLRCIAAHLGGYCRRRKSIDLLKDTNVMYDTSSSLRFISPAEGADLIRKIGASRFLFGTDFPMWTHEQELEHFLAMNLTEEENQAILYDNFAEFFGV